MLCLFLLYFCPEHVLLLGCLSLSVLSLLLEVVQSSVDPGPPCLLLCVGGQACRPEGALLGVTGAPAAEVAAGVYTVTCLATGLIAGVEDHEELVASQYVIVIYGNHTLTAVVCRPWVAVRAVVRTLADLPSRLDHAIGANDSVLFVKKELVVFLGEVRELKVVAVGVSHLA